MIDVAKLAEMIRSKRGSKGLRATADEIGSISSSTLSRVEQGNLPDIDTYFAICKWLGVSTEFFAIGNKVDDSIEHTVEIQLRADRTLPKATADALIAMIKLAYDAQRSIKSQGQAT